jgi:hypothetical protein
MGVLYLYRKQYPDAERFFLRSLSMMEKGMGPDHPMQVRTLSNLAMLAGKTGDRKAAEEWLNRALELTERRLGTAHPVYGMLLVNYASYLHEDGQKSRAKALRAKASQILKDAGRRNGIGATIDVSALKGK